MVSQPFLAPNSAALTVDSTAPSMAQGAAYAKSNVSNSAGSLCSACTTSFVEGTLIQTPNGPELIESLQIGQVIWTQNRNIQPIVWIKGTTIRTAPETAPIVFAKGAVGNTTPLWLSPNHRVLVSGRLAKSLFGKSQVLIKAKAFLGQAGVSVEASETVTYYQFMFETHCIVDANGALTESFYPGKRSLGEYDQKTRDEIFTALPELEDEDYRLFGAFAAYGLQAYEAKLFFHAKSYNL